MELSGLFVAGDSNGIGNSLTVAGADDLKLTFKLVPGKTLNDVVNALNDPNAGTRMAIAFHVHDVNNGSATYIGSGDTTSSGPPTVVGGSTPLPSVVWAGLPLLGLVALRRRFAARKIACRKRSRWGKS